MSLPRKLHAITAAVVTVGALLAWWNFHRAALDPGALILLLGWGLLAGSEPRTEYRAGRFRLTLLPPAICTAQIVAGTAGALAIAGAGALADSLINRTGKTERELGSAPVPYTALFHLGNTWVAAGAAGLGASGTAGLAADLPFAARAALAAVVWGLLFAGLLSSVEALAHANARDYPLREERRRSLARWGPNVAAGAAISLASLFLYGTLGAAGALGFLAVLCLVHFANRFYLERDLASRQFDSLLAGARDGVAILQDYTIIYANEAFAEILNRSRDAIIGTEYPRYLPPHALGWTDLSALTQAGLAEMEMRRPDNSLVRVEVSISPVLYHGRQCTQIVARDVTARYAIQRQAAQTQKLQAMGQMAAGVAHDFNNALMSIVGNLSVARAILVRPGSGAEALLTAANRLKMAEQAAMDAASTVRRLQIYSRPAPDAVEIVDVADLLREVRLVLRPLWQDASRASGKDIRVEVSALSPLPVRAAPAELREALANLVTNAVQALPDGGVIRLGATAVEREVIITIADTGTGMAPEVVDHVFEPFFSTKGKGGTGLGLFVAAGIVAHHGGRIQVESAPGQGTTFSLHFAQAGEGLNEEAVELPPVPAGLRALLVEDDAPVREATAGMLESAGVNIDMAADGSAALEALAKTHYDVMITDLSMPGMTGVELARAARARYPDLPIVLLSGWLGKAHERSHVEADGLISVTLNKPLQLPAMLHAINNATATGAGVGRTAKA